MGEIESADPLLGSMLGKNYRVLERIGMGGMAVIYLVEHQTLQKQFAAKVLQSAHASSAEARARFTQEAHAASQLDHENIVTISDFGVTPDHRPYFVMELLRGQTLADRLEEGPMTLEEVVAITVPAVRGLAHAHAEGLIHRDVKPENIFLVQRSQGRWGVKVLDFGIAKVAVNDGMTVTGQALGSPMYMAPEACRGDDIDARADVYSFGILLYLMLAGRVPFADDNLLKVLQMQVLEEPPKPTSFNPALPAALEQVILRALAKDPDARYASMDELLVAFEQALPEGSDVLLLQAHLGGAATPLPGSLERVRHSARNISASGNFFSVTTGRHEVGVSAGPPNTAPISRPPAPARRRRIALAVGTLMLLGGGAAAYVVSQQGSDPEAETARVAAAADDVAPAPGAVVPLAPSDPAPVPSAPVDPVPAEPAEPTAPTELAAPPEQRADPDELKPDRSSRSKPAKSAARQPSAKPVEVTRTGSVPEAAVATPAITPTPAAPPDVVAIEAPAPEPVKPEPVKPAPEPVKPAPEPVKPTPEPVKPTAPAKVVAGSLDATPTVASLDVSGSLPASIVRRSVERALPALRTCYRTAAKQKNTTPPLRLAVRFEIDESASARSVSTSGASFGSLADCARTALQQVQSPQAPDVGTVHVALSIRFTPL